MKSIKLIAITILGTLCLTGLTACEDDHDHNHNEHDHHGHDHHHDHDHPKHSHDEEVMNKVVITLKEKGTDDVKTLTWWDKDGEGTGKPEITTGTVLDSGKVYKGDIKIYNTLEKDVEDVTKEIKEEANEHQFVYTATNSVATFKYEDKDDKDLPLGLAFTMTTNDAAADGKLTFTLKHEPTKKSGEATLNNIGGETDIEVAFDVKVKK